MAEGTAGTDTCGVLAGSCTGQWGPAGSCSAAGCGGTLESQHGTGGVHWEAGMHRGLCPGFCWVSLECPGG